jgi:hypothetical protein
MEGYNNFDFHEYLMFAGSTNKNDMMCSTKTLAKSFILQGYATPNDQRHRNKRLGKTAIPCSIVAAEKDKTGETKLIEECKVFAEWSERTLEIVPVEELRTHGAALQMNGKVIGIYDTSRRNRVEYTPMNMA